MCDTVHADDQLCVWLLAGILWERIERKRGIERKKRRVAGNILVEIESRIRRYNPVHSMEESDLESGLYLAMGNTSNLYAQISTRTGWIQSNGSVHWLLNGPTHAAIKQQLISALFDCVLAYRFNQYLGEGQEGRYDMAKKQSVAKNGDYLPSV